MKNGEQIAAAINFNNKKIENLLKPGTFILNREVQALIESNDMLRAECPHVFEKGICIYCGKDEKNV